MPKYIDADELIGAVDGNRFVTDSVKSYVRCTVRNIPAADVEPKGKTGRWKRIGGKRGRVIDRRIVTCSICGNDLSMEGVNAGRGNANYCPNCGAKMLPEPPKEEENAE